MTATHLSQAPHGVSGLREKSDAELVRLSRKGDQGAFRVLVARYERYVAATVTGMLGPGPEADDVGQETFMRFYESLDRYRGDAGVGTYLTRIAVNLSINASRKRQRWHKRFLRWDANDPGPPVAEDATPEFEQDRMRREVRAAIERLTPKLRAVVVLRVVQEFSVKETAEILGVPVGTVLSRMSRAQEKLKDMLLPYVQEDG